MKNKRSIMAAVVVAVSLLGSSAMAANSGHGMFPTDTLDQWKVGATVGYEYQTRDYDTTWYNLPLTVSDPDIGTFHESRKISLNTLKAEIQMGVFRGVQIGIEDSFEVGGELNSSLSNGWFWAVTNSPERTDHIEGFYNPTFSLRWDLLKTFSTVKQPAALVLEYGYKPAKWGSHKTSSFFIGNTELLDMPGSYGFDTHTVKVIGSYQAGDAKFYMGYVGAFSGQYDSYDVGDTHAMVTGGEYAFTPSLSLTTDLKYSFIVNRSKYSDDFENLDAGVSLPYQAVKNLWIVPNVKMRMYDDRTSATDDFVSTTSTHLGISTGVDVRFVF